MKRLKDIAVPVAFLAAWLTASGYTLHAFTMYIAIQVLQLPLAQFNASSDIPLMMRLFPLKQYGQFSSANAMLRHFAMIFGPSIAYGHAWFLCRTVSCPRRAEAPTRGRATTRSSAGGFAVRRSNNSRGDTSRLRASK